LCCIYMRGKMKCIWIEMDGKIFEDGWVVEVNE